MNDEAVDVKLDAHVEQVMQESGATAGTVALVGFLGEGPEGYCRLYTDPALRVGMDIRSEDIVHRHRISAEQDAIGGRSVIWVEPEAVHARPVEEEPAEHLEATFLTGALASGMQLPETRPGFAEPLAFTKKGRFCTQKPFCKR